MGFFRKLFGKESVQNGEEGFIVNITDESVSVAGPNRQTEEIFWKDITEIRFINTNDGPYDIDVWLALIGDDSGCLIPHGIQACEKVYDIVSQYDGFDFDNVIQSMSFTGNGEFLLWKRN